MSECRLLSQAQQKAQERGLGDFNCAYAFTCNGSTCFLLGDVGDTEEGEGVEGLADRQVGTFYERLQKWFALASLGRKKQA